MVPELTPLAALFAVRDGRRPFLLESGSDADGCGGASFCGVDPVGELAWRLGDPGDPFERLARAPNPCIGVGYLGYGLASVVEPRVPARPDPMGLPELSFAFYDAVWRLDHQSGRAEVLGPGARRLAERLASGGERPRPRAAAGPLGVGLDYPQYAARLERLLELIAAGDLYQANLTHPLEAKLEGDPAGVVATLRRFAAPFGGFLDLGGGAALVANSPERFLSAEGRRVESRPIKGTRARGPGDAAALARSDKDRAEHVMIVDLMRSDLGRVCQPGSVVVEAPLRVVEYPTLHHMVTTVAGELRVGVGLADLLRATFPGGSVTGAPKVRAMEVIAELEPAPRGVYTGAFGRLGPGRGLDVDLAMTIRTACCAGGRLRLGVGGGIVADSRPDAEWAESLLKARAFTDTLAALGDSGR
jgi:para-aminobenzoate synthetase component 1